MAEGGKANETYHFNVSGQYAVVVSTNQINHRHSVDERKKHLQILYESELDCVLLSKDDLRFCLKLMESGQFTPVNKMLSPTRGHGRAPTRFLIYGQPGVGKTTFCQKMAYDWAMEKIDNAAEEFDLLLLKVLGKTEGVDLETSLKRLGQAKTDVSTIDEALRHKDTKILLVLDGYDKASDAEKDQVRFLVQNRFESVFKLSSIILTTNEGYLSQQDAFFQCFNRRYELSRGKPTDTAPSTSHKGEEIAAQQVKVGFDRPSWMNRLLREEGEMTTQEEVRSFFTSCP